MMRVALLLRTLTAGLVLALGLAGPAAAEPALDKVSFGTNWVAEGEHGGFFQALADGMRPLVKQALGDLGVTGA